VPASEYTHPFGRRPGEKGWTLRVRHNQDPEFRAHVFDRQEIIQWMAEQEYVIDEETTMSGGSEILDWNDIDMELGEYFKGVPLEERVLIIRNPAEIQSRHHYPNLLRYKQHRVKPVPRKASGAFLERTTPPGIQSSFIEGEQSVTGKSIKSSDSQSASGACLGRTMPLSTQLSEQLSFGNVNQASFATTIREKSSGYEDECVSH
jgi:hypothetical protein